jgi:PAS domain-containing protein
MSEIYRLEAVSRYKQPDENVIKDLNDIVNLAAESCNTPVALITLLDEDKQWFKARKGVDIDCTTREVSFCNYTIQQPELLMVSNTTADDRFANNPLVTGDPNVRFYAGVPLTTADGHAIGSLCILDFVPRELTVLQKNTLTVLSKQVMNLMELNYNLRSIEMQQAEARRQNTIIEEHELKLNAIFDSSKDTHILVDQDLKVLAFNRAAAIFARNTYGKSLKIGESVLAYADKGVAGPFEHLFRSSFAGKTIRHEWHMRPGTKYDSWKELEFVPVKDKHKNIIGVALNSTDITERKKQQEKINIQNAALTRIAIIQSHELRRPVASLLGIMALIKMEQQQTGNPEYLELLELTVQELDIKIREIVKDSENTLNGPLAIVA